MRSTLYRIEDLQRLFRKQKIATMPELKTALGTEVDVTVFRKLNELSYRTSYSHRGQYYTLDALARFDPQGLWWYRSVGFSRHGTLVSTLETFVQDSEAGYFATELTEVLRVGVKEALLQLVRQGRLARESVSGLYVYCATDRARRREQLLVRKVNDTAPSVGRSAASPVVPDELKASIVLFFSLLDEKQRRLYAALESLKYGHGGDRKIADFLGLDVATVARGRDELLARDFELERIRKPGGGRKPAEKKHRKPSRPSRS